jgi:DNA-binding transcriptional ArsR family regulator
MAGAKDGGERRDKEDHYRRAALAHPLRRRILRLLLDGVEGGVEEIAAQLGEPPARVASHLRTLIKRDAVKARARGRLGARYRLAPEVEWARKMLDEYDSQDEEDDPGGRD